MSTTLRLNPPKLDNIIPAQTRTDQLSIPFQMNRSVGLADFTKIQLILKTVQTNVVLATSECLVESLNKKDNYYQAVFRPAEEEFPLVIGQYYKIQLAYITKNETIGFYSNAATFKFTSSPTVIIQGLNNTTGEDGVSPINNHKYDYVGVYINERDPSEKVYSYCFDIYNRDNTLLTSSGNLLHNSSKDSQTTQSIDEWTTRQGLQSGYEYKIVYSIKTMNGIEANVSYFIVDGQTVPSNLQKYYDFKAINNADSAYVELMIEPKAAAINEDRKLINGKFLITRSSSEDNFQTWHEMTRFILASWDTTKNKFLCKDYSVSQGVEYVYALQAYNNEGTYTTRQKTDPIAVEFEDMFLSDGKRQLRIRFNPKVSSFKTNILEAKMDTLGGKYPFFFRNGNVGYKEFPISGMISMLMDENEEFMTGIQPASPTRSTTPENENNFQNLSTSLTNENFKRERDFKLEVLNWLTDGKPKLFRSPGEGSYIVRLMNTSLSPNDTLGRMLHTFSSTAYEMADFTFENLRKYGMVMDNYIEMRELRTYSKDLYTISNGRLSNLNAVMATLNAQPNTRFFYKLQNDSFEQEVIVGPTGVYNFPASVLQENPLMEIYHQSGFSGWFPEATLIYSNYIDANYDAFSHLHSIEIKDNIAQWIGQSKSEIYERFEDIRLIKDIGLIYYLNIQRRDIIPVASAELQSDGLYHFTRNGTSDEHKPTKTELVYCDGIYYDGETTYPIGSKPDYRVQLRENDPVVTFQGTGSLEGFTGCEGTTATGGRIILTNVKDVNKLFLGNGVFVDIVYQEINRTYTTEITPGSSVKLAKERWLQSRRKEDFEIYYTLLSQEVLREEEDLIIDAL